MIKNRYTQFYVENKKKIDISTWSKDKSILELEQEHGWIGAAVYGNLLHGELNEIGPGIVPGDIVLDVGANIGLSSLYAESMGAKKIYCIEPDVNMFNILNTNKGKNWIIDNIAVFDEEGYVLIHRWPSTDESDLCMCTTLDLFFDKHNIEHIDYMKVDVEGHEKTIFENVLQSTWNKIDKMFIEYHSVNSLSEKERYDEIEQYVARFRERGFTNTHIKFGLYQSWIYLWK